jgi:hypothetical protein
VDFSNPEDVKSSWYPEACRLVRELTGAAEVFAFMGILRGGEENLGGGPALSAHVDFNEPALRGWVQRLAPDRGTTSVCKHQLGVVRGRFAAVRWQCAMRSVDKATSCWCASAMRRTPGPHRGDLSRIQPGIIGTTPDMEPDGSSPSGSTIRATSSGT